MDVIEKIHREFLNLKIFVFVNSMIVAIEN